MENIKFIFISALFFSCNQNNALDKVIKQNTSASQKTQKYLIGKFPECNLSDVYFVEAFDINNNLQKRIIIYNHNGVYSINNKFLFWGAQKHPILYYHNSDSIENQTDLKNLKINLNNNKFIFSNIDLQKANAEILKKVENGTVTDDDHIEAGGSGEFDFKQFLNDTKCGK